MAIHCIKNYFLFFVFTACLKTSPFLFLEGRRGEERREEGRKGKRKMRGENVMIYSEDVNRAYLLTLTIAGGTFCLLELSPTITSFQVSSLPTAYLITHTHTSDQQ